ncbi:MAG TPA: Gfo/Idh/MocA family oxidoreductase [Candidatus Acidoferrales bacterium]|nr:Gfo/Idh/MocA family oxidoreductase [Candidatus Acidoferrales bacterium]
MQKLDENIDRRRFLKQATAAGVGLGVAGYLGTLARADAPAPAEPAKPIGANDRITVAVCGTNGRGLAHIDCLTGLPGVEIKYICDVDTRAVEKGLKETAKTQANAPQGLGDFRKALADPSLDAVTIATPDHWHTPMAILALAAGKHVYVEKPCSHNPHEGEMLVEAVAKSGRVLQMGAQRRSFPKLRAIIGELHNGLIGKTYYGKAWYANNRSSIGHGKPAPIPEWLDYELWQGPAPRKPYVDNLIHYNWHWRWHWGTGEALNNGTHEIDVCRWALGLSWPTRVSSNGGRYAFQDDWETPDTQTISWDFPEGKTMSWEGRSCNSFPVEKLSRGTLIYGTEGTALLDGNAYTIYDKKGKIVKQAKNEETVDATNTLSSTGLDLDQLHFANFLDAVRHGTPVNCPATEGHLSVTLLHLGNISWRVGRELYCDTGNGHILHDHDAMKLWKRKYESGWEPKV